MVKINEKPKHNDRETLRQAIAARRMENTELQKNKSENRQLILANEVIIRAYSRLVSIREASYA